MPERLIRNFISYWLSILFFVLIISPLTAQDTLSIMQEPIGKNSIFIGANKLVNTFLFNGNAMLDFDLFGGNLTVMQQYRGTTLSSFNFVSDTVYKDTLSTDSVKKDSIIQKKVRNNITTDNEILNIKYCLPVWNNISFVAENNWIYGSYNKLGRLNGSAGLRLYPMTYTILNPLLRGEINNNTASYVELKGGIEKNNQLGVNVLGPLFQLNGNLADYVFEGNNIQASLLSDYTGLRSGRENADIDYRSSLDRNFDEYDKIHLEADYRLMSRDYLSLLAVNDNILPIETWIDSRINTGAKLDFALTNYLFGLLDFSIQKVWKNRYYKDFISSYSSTGVSRKRDELGMSFTAEGKYKVSGFLQNVGLSFSINNSENKVFKNFNISNIDLNIIKETEGMLDYNDYTTRFYMQTYWQPTIKDSIRFEYSVSLYQYNTPSLNNYDDRDEFSSIMSGSYSHKFNNSFKFTLTGEIQLYHLVYLNAQSSSNNKWNRNIRLRPKIFWATDFFEVNPELEILANYIAYDFEDTTYLLKSNSFRQLSYKDSITFFLGKMLSLQSYLNFRYSENGILFWNTFSELPQSKHLEKFVKIMLSDKFKDNSIASVGVRYYAYNLYSIGPEAELKIILFKGSYISLDGWYEFQNIGPGSYRTFPDFYLTTKINL
jgi:hypothetical protein